MKVNANKLLDKINKVNKTELALQLGIVRPGLYYHIYNLKKGKVSFKDEMIKKIGVFICDDENAFFI